MFGSRKLFSIVPRLLRGNQLRSGMATMPEPLKMKKTTKRYVRERLFFFLATRERMVIKYLTQKTFSFIRAGRIMIELDREKRDEIVKRRKAESLEFDYDFRSGDAVEVKVQDEGETRTTIYKGVIIAKRNKGLGSNFSLLNQIDEGERLELLIPTYAPSVKGIKVLQKAHIHKGKKRVRRSKLYYLRDRNPAEFTVA